MRIIHAPVASEQHTLIFDSIFPPLQHTTTKRKLEFIIKTLIAHRPVPLPISRSSSRTGGQKNCRLWREVGNRPPFHDRRLSLNEPKLYEEFSAYLCGRVDLCEISQFRGGAAIGLRGKLSVRQSNAVLWIFQVS